MTIQNHPPQAMTLSDDLRDELEFPPAATWYGNIDDLDMIPVYEAAIKEAGVDLHVWKANEQAPKKADWRGLWGPKQDLSEFWKIFRRLEAEQEARQGRSSDKARPSTVELIAKLIRSKF